MSENGGQRAGVRSRRSEDRCQQSDIKGREMVTERIKSAKDLRVYKKAYALAMEIFNISKRWPAEEKFSLTDQIRRSSRSTCGSLREAWAKRRYEAHLPQRCKSRECHRS